MNRRNAEMDVPANKHIAFVKHVGKGVVAVCVIALGFLLGCEDRLCAAPQRDNGAIETREVIMCDVVVRAYGAPASYLSTRPESLRMDLKLDPRFHVPGPVERLYVYINRGGYPDSFTSTYGKRLEGAAPDPALYDVPPDMTVYMLNSYGLTLAIRVDGTTFLGHEVFVDCPRGAVMLNGKAARQCQIETPITDKTSVNILFFDDAYPPETWREMLTAVEAGIRDIITLKSDKPA